MKRRTWKWMPLVLLAASGWGCASAVAAGQNTALSGVDLVQMTDDMARRMVADGRVQRAIAERGSLKVVVQPVENLMTAEVLPAGQADAFTARVRNLLSRHAPEQFTWIMNREAYYTLRGQELGGVDLGPAPGAIDPEYALTATFRTLTKETSAQRSSFYLCSYRLTDLNGRTELWSGEYTLKKVAVKRFLD